MVCGGFAGQPVHAQSTPFNDIEGSYAKSAIVSLYKHQIVNGTSASAFSPRKKVSRAELLAALERLLKLEKTFSPVTEFDDVQAGAWYFGYVQAAVQLGLADGTSATSFQPDKPVTRQEAAVLLQRVLKQPAAAISTSAFRDRGSIAFWAAGPVSNISKLGLMKGDGTGAFRPDAPVTRQEMAVLLYRIQKRPDWSGQFGRPSRDRIQLGWQYLQSTEQYKRTVLKAGINILSPRWYFIGEQGAVSDGTDPSLVKWASENGKKVWALVGNRSNRELTSEVLSDPSHRAALAKRLFTLVKQHGLNGLNIDFENMTVGDRSEYALFIKDLAKRLHSIGAKLSVDVAPDFGADWTDEFDYAALGAAADYVVLMSYEEHWIGSPIAGSVASLPWSAQGLKTLMEQVSANKIILGMPLFSRDWTFQPDGSFPSHDINLTEQNRLLATNAAAVEWNSFLGQYEASYTVNGLQHRIWLEEGRSLTQKTRLALDNNTAGLAYWYTGGGSDDVWASIRNAIRFNGYAFD
ncbi:hypothetical protein VN24_18150 [Paenibacillus beijingensis]|uniref:Glycoside hydrolase n=1 Tax=Paenibacillus beijingensis TaxID=1126833 RepID=A0A0D5NRC0_9BACL|nr:hypothetical protein VN24_18150 [Paenibacillus beijingensis]